MRVHRCNIWSWFEIKSIDYFICNVDEIFICKIRIELRNNKKMYVSNHIWCQTLFGPSTSMLNGHVSTS